MGARHKIKLPSLGETVESVVVVEWHVSEGEEVKADAPLLTVETDKVDTEVPAPIAGKVSEILVPAGAELAVGDPVCIIEEGALHPLPRLTRCSRFETSKARSSVPGGGFPPSGGWISIALPARRSGSSVRRAPARA